MVDPPIFRKLGGFRVFRGGWGRNIEEDTHTIFLGFLAGESLISGVEPLSELRVARGSPLPPRAQLGDSFVRREGRGQGWGFLKEKTEKGGLQSTDIFRIFSIE